MREEHDQVGAFVADHRETVLNARRNDHGVVLLHRMRLTIDANFKGAVHDHNQLVDLMGVERRAGAWFGGVQAEGTGNSVLFKGHVPLSVAGPPWHFGNITVVDYGHVFSRLGRVGFCIQQSSMRWQTLYAIYRCRWTP